jgi:hypothetical protein
VLFAKYRCDHQVTEVEMGRACSKNGEDGNAYRILAGKPEGKRPLGRPRRRWGDDIKINLRQRCVVLTGLIWLRMGTNEGPV